MTGVVAAVIVGLAALIVGLLVGYILRKSIGEKTIGNAEQKAKNLIDVYKRQILGIPVLDHIVIGDGCYVSMRAQGMI